MMVEDQCSRYTRSVAVARTSALRCGMLTNRPEEEPSNKEGKTAYRGEQSDGKQVGENPAYRQRHHPPKAHLHAVDDNPFFFEAWLEATRDGAVYRRGFLALDVGLGRDTCQSRVTQSQDSLGHNFYHSSRFDNCQVVLARASQPLPTPLGTLDAIHLASALLWQEKERKELVMATHDTAASLGRHLQPIYHLRSTRIQRIRVCLADCIPRAASQLI